MSYTPTTWATGDTITAAKLNNMEDGIANAGGGWDAIIRLTHAENSAYDAAAEITPSIVDGTYADLAAKIQDGGCPCILVEYANPFFGKYYAAPMGFVTYCTESVILIDIAGFFSFSGSGFSFGNLGPVAWTSSDTIDWGD